MRTLCPLTVAIALGLGLTAVAVAQGTGPTPGGGQGVAPGAKSAGDPSRPPTTGEKIPPTSAQIGVPTALGSDDGTVVSTRDSGKATGSRVVGRVTRLDQASGRVVLQTDTGDMELRFPPDALQDIKEGDRVEVQLGLKPTISTRTGPGAPKSP